MKLVATIPARNEAHEIGLSARVALQWCDELVILNHSSWDRTPVVLAQLQGEYPHRVQVLWDPADCWTEMQHRQMLLEAARRRGATHVAIVDADEILTANLLPHVRTMVEQMGAASHGVPILYLPGCNLRHGIGRYHANGIWGNRWFALAFPDDPRLNWHGDTFHHREPFGAPADFRQPLQQGTGGVMHLWGANERRLRAKHALYQVTERIRWPDKPVETIRREYTQCVYPNSNPHHEQNWTYADVPSTWWEPYVPWVKKYLDLDAEPWQEAAVREMIRKHGKAMFQGLDLLGVA